MAQAALQEMTGDVEFWPSSGLDISGSRILVVDDLETSRRLLGMMLQRSGFHNLFFVGDGLEAIEEIARIDPDIMLLDVVMPSADGFDVLRRLRSDPRWADLPIVVQTAMVGPETRRDSFRAGATDFVTKPYNSFELVARIRLHLENRKYLKGLVEYHSRLSAELASARGMQQALLPTAAALQSVQWDTGVTFASAFEPSSELGGDFWGIIRPSPSTVGFYAVDFSGHGVTAALNTFRLHVLIEEYKRHHHDPATLLDVLNARLVEVLAVGTFATMFVGLVDLDADRMVYATAAAPNLFVHRPGQAHFEAIDGSGLALGVAVEARYANREIEFPQGTTLFHSSDALTDAGESGQALLVEEDLAAVLDRNIAADGPRSLVRAVAEASRYKERLPLADDLTMIAMRRGARD